MTLILFAQTLLGILFVIRTNQYFRARALLSSVVVANIGTIFVFSALIIAISGRHHVFVALLASCANIFCAFVLLIWCERRQFDALKGEVPFFLDRWILNLRLGSAPATAREQALKDHSDKFGSLLRPIFAASALKLSRTNHSLLPSMMLSELESIQREPHLALARLEFLRESLRKSADFGRRSGQATRQTQIQASLMMLMIFALTVFTVQRYGWSRVSDLVIGSWLLSAMGTLTMRIVAKKTRWKI